MFWGGYQILLSQSSLDLSTWEITPADCVSLLDGQRLYAETIASSVFGPGITSQG
jgi:hypothetical protein